MLAIAILVVPLVVSIPSAKAATTLGELTRYCEQLESFWRMHPATESGVFAPTQWEAAICFGYLQPFVGLRGSVGLPLLPSDPQANCYSTPEGKIAGGPQCRFTLGICMPRGVRLNQILAVFLAYARSNAAHWHEEAAAYYRLSLMAAFPCGDDHYAQ
jgi:hypothetical protein